MTKQKITEENDKALLESWVKDSENWTASVDIAIEHLSEDFEHDYGTIVYAMFAVMKAAMSKLNKTEQGGITGFQASCLGWLLIKYLFLTGESPLRLVKYDEMLFPQYGHKFEKTIDAKTWKYLQDKAKENYSSPNMVHPDVLAHWKAIVDGVVPFGYVVET